MTRSRSVTFSAKAAVIPLAGASVAACGGAGFATVATQAKTTARASVTVGVGASRP
jgi:hypothetical protein